MVVALMEVGKLCGSKKTYLLGGGRKRNAQVGKRHTVEMLRKKFKPGGGGLPWWLSGKQSTCNARDPDSIPGLGRSPGEGNGYPLQDSCLENSMDSGVWQATIHVVTNSKTRLSRT